MDTYDVYSEFDAEKHKKTFTHYFEAMIDEYGVVHYAVPSHQEWAIQKACERLYLSRKGLWALCPEQYWLDVMPWLCRITGCVAVWETFYICHNLNEAQRRTLEKLKAEGIYLGEING